MKKLGDRILLMLVCIILGLMLAAQFKNVQNVGGSVSLQQPELTAQIQKLNQEIESQQKLIQELEDRVRNMKAQLRMQEAQ